MLTTLSAHDTSGRKLHGPCGIQKRYLSLIGLLVEPRTAWGPGSKGTAASQLKQGGALQQRQHAFCHRPIHLLQLMYTLRPRMAARDSHRLEGAGEAGRDP